jgi:hypothetical protein
MPRARTIGLIAALAPALLFASACGAASEVKSAIDTAEICVASGEVIKERFGKVEAAGAQLTAGKAPDPTKLAVFTKTVGTEFGALHTSLKQQSAKAKDAEVKAALEGLNAAIAGWAAKPESFMNADQTKVNAAGKRLEEACQP